MRIQELPALLNDLFAVIVAEMPDMRLGRRGAEQDGQPFVCSVLGHQPSLIELVKIQMRGAAQVAQFLVGQGADGDLCALMDPDVGITLLFRVLG